MDQCWHGFHSRRLSLAQATSALPEVHNFQINRVAIDEIIDGRFGLETNRTPGVIEDSFRFHFHIFR